MVHKSSDRTIARSGTPVECGMDAYKALLTRRSIRRYTNDPVPSDITEKLLRVAMLSPSASNRQPWHFVVIDDRQVLQKLPEIHPYAKMAASAPLAIVVCGDPALTNSPGWIPQDCSAATENVLLGAHALGLGGVWCGIHPDTEREAGFRSLLNLPEGIVPFSLVVLGYPAEEPKQPDRFQPDRVHENGW